MSTTTDTYDRRDGTEDAGRPADKPDQSHFRMQAPSSGGDSGPESFRMPNIFRGGDRNDRRGLDAHLILDALRNAAVAMAVVLCFLLLLVAIQALARTMAEITGIGFLPALFFAAVVPIAAAGWTVVRGRG